MKRIRVDELKVGDRILTLDGKRTVMQRGDDKVTVIDAKMEMKGNEENHE